MQHAWESSGLQERYPFLEWVRRRKYQPSLDGHLRATLVPRRLVELGRACAIRLRIQDDPILRQTREAIDKHVQTLVIQGRLALEKRGWSKLLECVAWRRLILWCRARVAARRVLESHVLQTAGKYHLSVDLHTFPPDDTQASELVTEVRVGHDDEKAQYTEGEQECEERRAQKGFGVAT